MDDNRLIRLMSRDLADMHREGQSRVMFADELRAIWNEFGNLRLRALRAEANAGYAVELLRATPIDLNTIPYFPSSLDFMFPIVDEEE